jgi:hypothetical protein
VDAATAAGQAGVKSAVTGANTALNPYTQAGAGAVGSLQSLLQNNQNFAHQDMQPLEMDPGYQFRLQQAQQAVERSAAARGGSMGGAALQDLNRVIQGVASDEYGKAFDRFDKNRRFDQSNTQLQLSGLQGLSTLGYGAATQTGQNLIGGEQFAGNLGLQGAHLAGGMRIGAAQYAGDTGQRATAAMAGNTLQNAGYQGDMNLQIGNAKAAEHIARANGWNNMLNGIGRTGDAFLSGGFGGGFSGGNGGYGGGYSGNGGFSYRGGLKNLGYGGR